MKDDSSPLGEHLLTHRAPDALLERALRRPVPPPVWLRPMMIAAVFLIGVVVGQLSVSNEPSTSPVVEATGVPIKLVLHAPDAATVSVAGSWNDWETAAAPMQRAADGTFFTVVHLPRGRHEYMFVVDGEEWVTDPTALLTRDDGFGRQNGLIEI